MEYISDMARYADIENLNLKGIAVFDENLDVLIPLSDVRKALQMLPTADVVPRAEVEKWKEKSDRFRANLEAVLEERAETKQQVAMEIFAEIERNMVVIDDVDFHRFRAIGARTFAELKKKYTENLRGAIWLT